MAKPMEQNNEPQMPDTALRALATQISEIPTAGVPMKNLALATNNIAICEKALRKLKNDLLKQMMLSAQQQSLSV